ncbi:MAG: gliding motility-associated C-terminal domain-containing protein [Bacteroidetes bacterium]|nr:gliding motility-associated C-terminal domain-containing protein [Bacteroidota bacterium]
MAHRSSIVNHPPPPPVKPQNNTLFFPNTFSPNSDGLNDIFKAKTASDNITHFHLFIYKRWGGLVFESKSITEGWDGQYNGQPAPEGTYVYRVEYAVGGGEMREVDGVVVVVR